MMDHTAACSSNLQLPFKDMVMLEGFSYCKQYFSKIRGFYTSYWSLDFLGKPGFQEHILKHWLDCSPQGS